MKELLAKMSKVNPTGGPTSHCVACTGETTKILLAGEEYEPRDVSKDSEISDQDVLRNGEKVGRFDNGDELVNWLANGVEAGTILIGAEEDHMFNILKSYEGTGYLIDTDLFKVISLALDNSFKVSITPPGKKKEKTFKYFK